MQLACAALVLLLATTVGCDLGDSATTFTDTDRSAFQVGQVWQYRTRPQEAASTLVVVKVETDPDGETIVHIGVTGVQFQTPTGIQTTIPHMPFDEAALRGSVTTKVRDDGALTDFQEGYRIWRDAVNGQRGGVFAISVADAIATTEEGLTKGP
jgi:hypothetical protein